jgi:dipeptidase E
MKLLLTSAGITNNSISKALFDLVGKEPEDTSLAFIPTAANIESGDKDWFINDLNNLKKLNLKSIDIVDISAVSEDNWRPRLEAVDAIFFEGGNVYHLMEWVNKSGLRNLLPELLKTRVYVGLSAGSMITNPDLSLKISQVVYDEDLDKTEDVEGLKYVDLYLLPHLNSKWFPKLKEPNISEAVKDIKKKVYALDDESALKIVDDKIDIISEGDYLVYN